MLFGLIALVAGACSNGSRQDDARANALAQDLILVQLDSRWEPVGNVLVRPAREAPFNSAEVVAQDYEIPGDSDEIEELRFVAAAMSETGWEDRVANCESLSVSAQKADEFGYVSISVGVARQDDSEAPLRARANVFASLISEARTSLDPRGEDLSCLS